jgi:3alpha(or 20beta)-hydroxysteroid dehydrogenase
MRLQDGVAIITGAARGQGEAEARAFLAEGASVVLGDVLEDEGRALADELGDAATFVTLDVTDEGAWQKAVRTAKDTYGRITALVNNAGISPMPKAITETSVAAYRKVIDVNQIGAFIGIHTTAPEIAAAGGGTIVNISSVNGFVAAAGIVGYVTSKFALRGLTKTAALELAGANIRVNSVHPGPVDTPMVQPEAWGGFDMRPMLTRSVPAGRLAGPEEIAELVVWLSSDASRYCTGAEFVIDGGYLAGPFVDLGGR